MSFRQGTKVPINVYDGDTPACQCQTVAYAKQIVDAVNGLQALTSENAILDHENVNLHNENARLRAAVANQAGDDLCWMDGQAKVQIPPRAEFLESCARYHAQMAESRGVLNAGQLTIAQLEAANAKLRSDRMDLTDKLTAARAENDRRRMVEESVQAENARLRAELDQLHRDYAQSIEARTK